MSSINQEKYYKITRKDGTPLFDASKPPIGIAYKDGGITKLPPGEFKDNPECGGGLHYGSIDSAVFDGLIWEKVIDRSNRDISSIEYNWAVVPTLLNFRVFEAVPLGKQVKICSDKYKTDELKTIELTPEEYLPLFLSSEHPVVREIGAMKLSQQSENLKTKLGFYNNKDKTIRWLEEWNYLEDLDKFVGTKVTTTEEYSEYFDGRKIKGTIASIDPISLVAILKSKKFLNIPLKREEVLNIEWLQKI